MNIALFSDTYLPECNGVATSTSILFDELKNHGHNVYIVTSNPFSKKIEFKDNIIRIPGIILKHLYNYMLTTTYSRKVMKYLRQLDLDVIHIQCDLFVSQFGWIASNELKCATVYTYHTMYEDYTWYATRGAADRFAKWSVREYSKTIAYKSTEFIVPSIKTKDYIRRIGIKNYVNVIPTGIQVAKYKDYIVDKDKKEELYKKYNIDPNASIFIAVGRVALEKNISEIINFFIAYKTKFPGKDIHLLVVGNGPLLSKLVEECTKNGSSKFIHFIGRVPFEETPFYYNIAEFYLSGSTSETQGLTYIEAMACGNIVIARYDVNLVGIIDSEINGYFYETYSEFEENLTEVLAMSIEEKIMMKTKANQTADSLSAESFEEKVLAVYERAIRENW
ncbi:MAG: glycosyltransferase [Bacilli bacterium]